ncbi:hypothetical protein PAAG_11586 [Paracoccidioides lutzii Pb01]|uniref:Uncharacterized protein n=1 Tax=Paracoccidioides lutzii (strain ATCC MYA-826 / Pb01) TaxID=502779 RepID=A0A0A2V687_PARBA|nr:hypothetical protein PAAG_11586 [Paracoccidioides lutzii Pb01]KGQ01605.1 hypothetical protein PAAG_11586 [Paracoccidioides lutzii Pb01]
MTPATTPARQAPPSRGNGSVSRTPRFIFSSNFPSSSASQFAATPRFCFTEKGKSHVSDVEANLSDVIPSSSSSALTESYGQTGNLPQAYPGGDIIQDSSSDEEELLFQDDTPSPPLEGYPVNQGDAGGGFDIDAEFDAIFPPTPEMRKAKRRRVSLPPPNSVLDLQHPSSAHSNGQLIYTPGHPAPVTLITANPINHPNPYPITTPARTNPNTTPSPTQQHTQPPPRKILLFGAPMSAPSRSRGHRHAAYDAQGYPQSSLAPLPTIAKGDKIGIRRGLVWEMEIEEFAGGRGRRRMRREEEGGRGEGEGEGEGGGLRGAAGTAGMVVEKWIVGVEWDVLEWKDG